MTLRRGVLCGIVLLPACSVITTFPDLTGGTIDASVDVVEASTCPPHVFTYDPKGRNLSTVHVSGSFNGWPKTIDAGGWPMGKSGSTWTLTHVVPTGKSTYKLVLNESEWITDPSDPDHVPDGFGGQNSVIVATCGE